MKLDASMEPVVETSGAAHAHTGECQELDGDVCIEGDGGTVDNSGQVYVPPPPPPR